MGRFTLAFLLVFSTSSFAFSDEHKTRVYADISGDLFHRGHVEFFKQARTLGDSLVIGVLSDETIASYKRVPVLTLQDRVAVIEACKYVDEVIADPPLRVTKEWLEEHKIDIVVHGDDFSDDMILDQYKVPYEMGILRLVHYTEGISTTDIIARIKSRIAEDSL